MKLIDRYILREFLIPLSCCLSTFCMIFVVFDLFDHLPKFLDAQTPLPLVIRYYGCVLVPALEFLVPASLLLATLYTLWQMARNSELTAMRASGLSLYRIMLPLLGVGCICSLSVAALKEFVAPNAAYWATEFYANRFEGGVFEVHRDHAYYNARDSRIWRIDAFDPRQPRVLMGVEITEERPDFSRRRKIFADKAAYLDGQWWLHDVQVQEYDDRDNPTGGLQPPRPRPGSVQEMPQLTEIPEDFLNEVKPWRFLTSMEMYRYLQRHIALPADAIARRTFDLHSRLAMPWACLVVTFFGIPTGARTGRQGILAGILMAGVCFFGFYALMQVGIFLGKKQILYPWLAAWLSNIVFFMIGLVMLRRMT